MKYVEVLIRDAAKVVDRMGIRQSTMILIDHMADALETQQARITELEAENAELQNILIAAPADLLRKRAADVWGKARAVIDGLHPRCTEQCDLCAELDLWLSAFDDANPYRVKPEDER